MEPFPAEAAIAKKFAVAAMQQGLIVYPSRNGFKGKTLDFFSVAPPLVITKEQIDELIAKLDAAISDISSRA